MCLLNLRKFLQLQRAKGRVLYYVHPTYVGRIRKLFTVKIASTKICPCFYERNCLGSVEAIKLRVNRNCTCDKCILFRDAAPDHQDIVFCAGKTSIADFTRYTVSPC